jgi:hypothetical protein
VERGTSSLDIVDNILEVVCGRRLIDKLITRHRNAGMLSSRYSVDLRPHHHGVAANRYRNKCFNF